MAKAKLLMTLVLVTAFLPFTAGISHGAGFTINSQGATALGQGNSVIAHTDDPSSVFFNPALINKLDGTQIEIGTTMLIPSTSFHSDVTGRDFKTEDDVFFPSTLFVTHKFSDRLSAGFGIFSNFGLSTNWPDDWEGRFITTKSELKTYTINPAISYKPIPHLTVAAGVDVIFLDAELNKKLNAAPLGLPDIPQRLKGDDTAVGFNLGLLVELSDNLSVGGAYRSRINADIDGNVSHGLPAGMPAPVASLFPNTPARMTLKLPAQANFGIAYKGFKNLTLEVGGRWEEWSSFKELRIKTDQPIAGNSEILIPKDWKDIYSVNAGARYQVSKALALMAGYIHENGPIPDSTFDPSIPDNGSNIFLVGADLRYKNFLFSLAYDYQRVPSRNKSNAVDGNPVDGVVNPAATANGRYKTHLHIVGVSITYRF